MFNAVVGRKMIGIFAVCLVLLCLTGNVLAAAKDVISFEEEDGQIRISNRFYQVEFDSLTGGIVGLKDKINGEYVSRGNAGGLLWWAFLSNGDWVQSTFYENSFHYDWNPELDQLRLFYPADGANMLDVVVLVSFSHQNWFTIGAQVTNGNRSAIQTFGLPYQLLTSRFDVKDALLPLLPGVKLNSLFFEDGRSYQAQYPGVLFADFVALRSIKGQLAIYGQQHGVVQPTILGFEKASDNESYRLIHNYTTWIKSGNTWLSPNVYIRIGEGYEQSIAAFRNDSGISQFPNIKDKLGDKAHQFFASPMYKLDVELINQPFSKLKTSVIDSLDVPGLVHPVAFQSGGHDQNYPDFVPPDDRWGTTEDFADLVLYAKEKGNLVLPYTNLSWWDTDGPTLTDLPAGIEIKDLTVLARNGTKKLENYGPGKDGYVMNLHNVFVKERILAEHRELINEVHMDGIFEDQWGARSAPYDFNPAGLSEFDPATSYFQGVLAHAKANAAHNLMTEIGVDRLAEYEVGFMGTNFLWDKLGYRPTTAPYSTYFPMAGMLFRDKVLLYQHDLAEETWTNNRDMFRWNLTFGYNFSNAFYINGGLYTANPWLDLVGVFQRYVLSEYVDQLILGYAEVANSVFKTTYPGYTVYSNWSSDNTFTYQDHTIPIGGAMVNSNDGTVTAGVFKSYNNRMLSSGEHYIVELRDEEEIRVFQPVGTDTEIFIRKYPNWIGVAIKAYEYDGTYISDVEGKTDGGHITFELQSKVAGTPVGYYQLTESAIPNPVISDNEFRPDLVIKDVVTSPDSPSVGDEVIFSVVIENVGKGPTPEDVVHDVSVNLDANQASFWSRSFTRSIAPGAIVTIELSSGHDGPTWVATRGDHVISATVDDYGKIAESNESNNYFLMMLDPIKDSVLRAASDEPISQELYALKTDLDLMDDAELEKAFKQYVHHRIERVVVGEIESLEDASGSFGILWDEQNLYFLADVIDDIKSMSIAQSAWQNDTVELYLDMNYSGGTSYMKDDFQYMFSWNNRRPYETKHNSVDEVTTRWIDTERGYRIFARIPWDTLGVVPEDEMVFGVDVAIDDNDSGTRDAQLIWNSFDEQAWQYPNRFGRGELTEDAKPDLKITTIAWEPEVVKLGDQLRFNATIVNQGTAPTPAGVMHRVDFHINGSKQPFFWSDEFASPLVPGGMITLFANDGAGGPNWTLHDGVYTITARIDSQGEIEELNEENNSAKRVIDLE